MLGKWALHGWFIDDRLRESIRANQSKKGTTPKNKISGKTIADKVGIDPPILSRLRKDDERGQYKDYEEKLWRHMLPDGLEENLPTYRKMLSDAVYYLKKLEDQDGCDLPPDMPILAKAFLKDQHLIDDKSQPTHRLIDHKEKRKPSQTPKPPAPVLEIPPHVGPIYHYTDSTIDILGRDGEQKALARFRDAGHGFRWWQIAGVAGQGKSRLALDLIKKTRQIPDWNAGFFLEHKHDKALQDFVAHCNAWYPDQNYLIVIDYVAARTEALNTLMTTFAARSETFNHAVCVLVVERQPWNVGSGDFGYPRADWFSRVAGQHSGYHEGLATSLYTDDGEVLTLTALQPENLIEIVTKVAAQFPTPLIYERSEIAKKLAQIDHQGRPLYAYFLGRALGARQAAAITSKDGLLDWVLEADRAKRWRAAGFEEATTPRIGSLPPNHLGYVGQNPSMHLALLATMIRELACNDLAERYRGLGWTPHTHLILREALAIADNPMQNDPEPVITGLQPDLLGEYFVLESLRKQAVFVEVTDLAWTLSSDQMAEFLIRITRDFPHHPTIELILNNIPNEPNEATRVAYVYAVSHIMVNLSRSNSHFPSGFMTMLRIAAEAGDGLAMSNLGVCYAQGKGVEKNMRTAVEWYRKGAKAENGRAMSNIGVCYAQGKGVEKNMPIALGWYRKGAKAGDDMARRHYAALAFALGDNTPIAEVETHITLPAIALGAVWADTPPLPGAWYDLLDTSEVMEIITHITQSITFEGQDTALTGKTITAARACDLSFYAGIRLCDIQVKDPSTDTIQILSALISPSHALMLDGTLDHIYALNETRLRLETDAQDKAYLQFFCRFIRTEQGPFYILDDPSDIPFEEGTDQTTLARVLPHITPIKSINIPVSPNRFAWHAAVLHGDVLSLVIYAVMENGNVTKIADTKLAKNLPVKRRYYRGMFRTPLFTHDAFRRSTGLV